MAQSVSQTFFWNAVPAPSQTMVTKASVWPAKYESNFARRDPRPSTSLALG